MVQNCYDRESELAMGVKGVMKIPMSSTYFEELLRKEQTQTLKSILVLDVCTKWKLYFKTCWQLHSTASESLYVLINVLD